MRKFITCNLVTAVLALLYLVIPGSVEASTLSLSAATKQVAPGGTVTVQIILNTTGESINGVSAYLNYPADKIEVVRINYGDSFPISAEGTFGQGSIKISRGSITGFTGRTTIATVVIKGKTEGAAALSFVGGSAAARTTNSSDSLNLGGSSGLTLQVSKSAISTITKPEVTVVKISDIKVQSSSTSSAVITWTTNVKATSEIDYGLDKDKYFLSAKDTSLTTTHSVSLSSYALVPGTKYHFRVKSTSADAASSQSDDQIFQLKGYPIIITVLDQNNVPVKNSKVKNSLTNTEANTDSAGKSHFENEKPGKNPYSISFGTNTTTEVLEIKDTSELQNFTVQINNNTNILLQWFYSHPLIALSIIAAVVVVITIIKSYKIIRS